MNFSIPGGKLYLTSRSYMISHWCCCPTVAPSKLRRLWLWQTLIVIMLESFDTNLEFFFYLRICQENDFFLFTFPKLKSVCITSKSNFLLLSFKMIFSATTKMKRIFFTYIVYNNFIWKQNHTLVYRKERSAKVRKGK